jgi:hypothetical protein
LVDIQRRRTAPSDSVVAASVTLIRFPGKPADLPLRRWGSEQIDTAAFALAEAVLYDLHVNKKRPE